MKEGSTARWKKSLVKKYVFFETKAFFFNFYLVLIGIKKIMEILSFLQIPSHLQVNWKLLQSGLLLKKKRLPMIFYLTLKLSLSTQIFMEKIRMFHCSWFISWKALTKSKCSCWQTKKFTGHINVSCLRRWNTQKDISKWTNILHVNTGQKKGN